MSLLDDVKTQRELVKRLIMGELLARRGEGPLALRSAASRVARQPLPKPRAQEDEP